jgi:hypothetical protein
MLNLTDIIKSVRAMYTNFPVFSASAKLGLTVKCSLRKPVKQMLPLTVYPLRQPDKRTAIWFMCTDSHSCVHTMPTCTRQLSGTLNFLTMSGLFPRIALLNVCYICELYWLENVSIITLSSISCSTDYRYCIFQMSHLINNIDYRTV